MAADPIRIDGLNEFVKGLKTLDSELPKAVRMAFNEAADIVVKSARPKIPSRSGRAKASVKARSTRTAARVVGGSTRVPYYPWLDFGGRVGRGKSVRRPFLKDGRYIYNAYFREKPRFVEAMERNLITVAERAVGGLD